MGTQSFLWGVGCGEVVSGVRGGVCGWRGCGPSTRTREVEDSRSGLGVWNTSRTAHTREGPGSDAWRPVPSGGVGGGTTRPQSSRPTEGRRVRSGIPWRRRDPSVPAEIERWLRGCGGTATSGSAQTDEKPRTGRTTQSPLPGPTDPGSLVAPFPEVIRPAAAERRPLETGFRLGDAPSLSLRGRTPTLFGALPSRRPARGSTSGARRRPIKY